MKKISDSIAFRFLRRFCPPHLMEEIEGDLLQKFERDVKSYGEKKAKRRLVWNVMRFFRPGIILRNKIYMNFVNVILLKSYFKISCRYLAKHRTFSIVNILGLALGMAAALLIYMYVNFENSYDKFHERASQIYRVTTEWNIQSASNDRRATTMPWSGPNVKDAFPDIIEYTRFAPLSVMTGNNSVRYKDTKIEEQNIYLADPGFLKIFSFSLLSGNPESALTDPHQILITESIAHKYFGHESPLGKIVHVDTHGNLSGNEYTITGVIQDPPENSHITFDFLISYTSMWEGLNNGSTYWHWDNTYCYLLLHPETNVSALEKKISKLRINQFGHEFNTWQDVVDFKLQPVTDIHLHSKLKNEIAINGDGRSIDFLIIVGIFILLSAYINYVNLSVVKSVERRTEIGVRKVVGSSKAQVTLQLLVESFVINILALLLAVSLAHLSVPVLENVFNIHWPAWNSSLLSLPVILIVIGVVFSGALLAALYPAFVMTAMKPAEVLKGSKPASITAGNRWSLRKSLTVLQFVFCMAFITGTFVLHKQVKFMKNHDLGMNIEQVIAVKGYGFQSYKSYENFKARLSASYVISSVGSSSAAPSDEINLLGLVYKLRAGEKNEEAEIKMMSVDADFFKTLNVEFIAGRNFDPASKTDAQTVILNEAAARSLGYNEMNNIIHQPLHNLKEKTCEIIGVIKNYNQLSLKKSYEPIVYIPNWIQENNLGWNSFYYFVRINPADQQDGISQAISEMEEAWKATVPEHPFNYFFLDSYFDRQYKSDTAFSSLFLFFSTFAIFITCIGLFGLVAYTTLQRTKEIGIRKVLGASVENILVLLSKDFVLLMCIAMVITIPPIAFGLQQWLETYAFRINLSVWLFVYPMLAIFILAFTTVMLKSLKVASANPIESIRYE